MKKLFIAACLLLGFAGFATAQEGAKKKPAKVVKVERVKPTAPADAPANVLTPKKADGTLDKRFKVNKTKVAPSEGPLKKDGTPDKRYKANKKA